MNKPKTLGDILKENTLEDSKYLNKGDWLLANDLAVILNLEYAEDMLYFYGSMPISNIHVFESAQKTIDKENTIVLITEEEIAQLKGSGAFVVLTQKSLLRALEYIRKIKEITEEEALKKEQIRLEAITKPIGYEWYTVQNHVILAPTPETSIDQSLGYYQQSNDLFLVGILSKEEHDFTIDIVDTPNEAKALIVKQLKTLDPDNYIWTWE